LNQVKILWTNHAILRQKEWEKSLGITREEVENLVREPAQIVQGKEGILVAQNVRNGGLLRVFFVRDGGAQKIVTLYWTSKIEKYWKGA
jgi:hypothetical protein